MTLRRAAAFLAAAALAAGLAVPSLSGAAATAAKPEPEHVLEGVFDAIEQNRLDLALTRVDALLTQYPNFRLAYLIRGDLLLARTRPLKTFGDVSKGFPRDRLASLRAEALARVQAMRDRPPSKELPRYILELSPEQRYAFVVESLNSRLYVYANRNGTPALIADYYVTLGKHGVAKTREGDQKTPLGVYYVTANLPRSKLTDFYGPRAFPISYPNEWDRREGRNGFGIWLHGTPPDTYSRPPRDSDGCIVLSNPDIVSVGHYVQVGLTPVIIADKIDWVEPSTVAAERDSLTHALQAWRRDWESRDTSRYLEHYSPRFHSSTDNLAAWAAHKRKVNAAKRWIKVGVSDVSMFGYPRQSNFVVVVFKQSYRSDTLSNVMRKRQYWVRENGAWKILYEGPA